MFQTMSKYPQRDYGYRDSPQVIIPPIIKDEVQNESCPECKGKTLFVIEVGLENEVNDRESAGVYIGCAACPYASPMMIRR